MSREELRDGYVRLMDEIYEPEAYFERLGGGVSDRARRRLRRRERPTGAGIRSRA